MYANISRSDGDAKHLQILLCCALLVQLNSGVGATGISQDKAIWLGVAAEKSHENTK
jgi:hypothetical protein